MMRLIRKLRDDRRGTAIIELAFALPVLIIMMWMIIHLGLVFRAMSGIQHGLGEGARYATLYPKPTDDAIKTKISNTVTASGQAALPSRRRQVVLPTGPITWI